MSRREAPPNAHVYHVLIETDPPPEPGQDTPERVRSRMGLLNAAMARIIREADEFVVTSADYESGCLELDVLTTRMRGIVDARVHVRVRLAADTALSAVGQRVRPA